MLAETKDELNYLSLLKTNIVKAFWFVQMVALLPPFRICSAKRSSNGKSLNEEGLKKSVNGLFVSLKEIQLALNNSVMQLTAWTCNNDNSEKHFVFQVHQHARASLD